MGISKTHSSPFWKSTKRLSTTLFSQKRAHFPEKNGNAAYSRWYVVSHQQARYSNERYLSADTIAGSHKTTDDERDAKDAHHPKYETLY
ncbi:hypothetical protein ccbrp13_20410 [Ktedonobacteria bacterium brp13]|nr:hypothetical protein ccbrp13_20410 [Ktedonobacteria bacterium brp13]